MKYIRERLSNHEVYIDSEALWKDLTTKRRKGFYLKIAFLALLLVSVISYFGIQYFNTVSSQNFMRPMMVEVSKLDAPQQYKSQELLLQKASSEHKEFKNLDNEISQGNSNEIISAGVAATNSHISSSIQNGNNDTGQSISTTTTNKKDSEPNISTHYPEDKGIAFDEDSSLSNFVPGSEIENNRDYINEVAFLGKLDPELSLINNSIAPQLKNKGIDCYDHSGKKMDLYLLGYTALDYVSSSMTSLPEFKDYLEDRQSSQKQLLGYRAGFQLKYLTESGLYLKAGIEYGAIRERFEYRKTSETDTILPNQLIEINIDLNGDTTLVYGNAPVKIIEMKNWKVANSYTSIGTHIFAGYQIEKGHFVYGIEAGIQYNMRFKFDGLVLNEKLEPFNSTEYFKSNTSLSIMAGVNTGYKLNNNWTLTASLDYRGNLENINSSQNLVDQKNNNLGLSVGLELKI
ncbi:MAG: hypothetical protein HKN67_00725 [Saprospiraceae bacterium]|nr:porin family protein [Bacteroidia bacterium]NNF20437.1 hypothetical protein [Saprospiraceae bacterium]